MYRNKYLKYKHKYIQLLAGANIAQPIILPSDNIRIYTPGAINCSTTCDPDIDCVICMDEYEVNDKVILRCGCCFHAACIAHHIRSNIDTQGMYNMNDLNIIDGLKCPKLDSENRRDRWSCKNPFTNIIVDDATNLTILFPRIPDEQGIIPEPLINEDNIRILREKIDELNRIQYITPTDLVVYPLMEARGKKCPGVNPDGSGDICPMTIIHYHGHGCHHITPGTCRRCHENNHECECNCNRCHVSVWNCICIPKIKHTTAGCPVCSTEFCYKCLSTKEQNRDIRGEFDQCSCPNNFWSSFCDGDIRREHIDYKNNIPYDIRCGCSFCPDCREGVPCEDCDGTCCVCQGLVNHNPNEIPDAPIPITDIIRPRNERGPVYIDREDLRNVQSIRNKIREYIDLLLGFDLNNYTITELYFINCDFNVISSGSFNDPIYASITILSFENCNILNFSNNNVFLQNNIIRNLTIKNSPRLQNINSLSHQLNRLETLIINHTSLITINELPPRIIHLNVSNNNIRDFNVLTLFNTSSDITLINLTQNKLTSQSLLSLGRCLHRLPRLDTIILSSNTYISEILSDTFRHISIVDIKLNGCKIKTIHTNAFIHLDLLRKLQLRNNPLNKIDNNAFVNCMDLTDIDMANTHIRKDIIIHNPLDDFTFIININERIQRLIFRR